MDDIKPGKRMALTRLTPLRYRIPGSQATILINQENGTISRYQIIEPELTPELTSICKSLRNHLRTIFQDITRQKKFLSHFSREFTLVAKKTYPELNIREIQRIEYYIQRDARGLGPLQPLMDDPFLSTICIHGPETCVTVQHSKYGILDTTLHLTKGEIFTINKKICNRSVIPVTLSSLPSEITLRSGHRVHFTLQDNGVFPINFTIRKKISRNIPEKVKVESIASGRIIATYCLYSDMVEVSLSHSALDQIRYTISMVPLLQREHAAIEMAREVYTRKSGLQSFHEGTFQFSKKEFSEFLTRDFPDIPHDRYNLLYIAFSFSQDTVRWIRVLLTDRQINRLLCTHPEKPVQVWHVLAPDGAETSVIPNRSDLNRFAAFLIKSYGKEINSDAEEISLRFRTGEFVSLTRVRDDQGHYYRIDIRKNTNTFSSDSTAAPVQKKTEIPPESVKKIIPDPRVEELLTKIFTRDQDTREKPDKTEEPEEKSLSNGITFSKRILNPIRKGLKGLSFQASRKEKPTPGDAPMPETLQVPSVLSVQAEDGYNAEEAYWLFQPHAYAVVLQDRSKDRSYRVIEPELSPRERIILEETHETLRDVLVYDKPVTKGDLFLEYDEVAKVVRTYDPKITDDRLSVLYYYLRRNLNGYGKIDALMYDELLEDISCNGHNLPVYIHHRYYGSIPTSIRFESEELNRFVLKLSQKADKQVSLTSPLLDASLPNGARAQITYSDVVSTKGSSFTIRKFRSDPMTPATLLAFGTYSDELLAFIWLALENRQSLIVVGGTASGKTSAMNAFSFFIPHNSKIVSLEDTREIQIPQKNWLPVQTRTSNSFTDRGSVDLFDLLKASLRQRPEYIIVGEVRGNEAQTLFQAMNSGHTTLSTLHAGNIEEALNRLTNEPINVPPAMFGALNLMVIQTFHYRGGRMIRRCDAIHEIVLGEGDKVNWNTLYEYEPKQDAFTRVFSTSKTLQTIRYMHNWSEEELKYQLDLRTGFLAKLRNQYSTDPEVLIRMITDLRRLA